MPSRKQRIKDAAVEVVKPRNQRATRQGDPPVSRRQLLTGAAKATLFVTAVRTGGPERRIGELSINPQPWHRQTP